jgi:hypothetical protein
MFGLRPGLFSKALYFVCNPSLHILATYRTRFRFQYSNITGTLKQHPKFHNSFPFTSRRNKKKKAANVLSTYLHHLQLLRLYSTHHVTEHTHSGFNDSTDRYDARTSPNDPSFPLIKHLYTEYLRIKSPTGNSTYSHSDFSLKHCANCGMPQKTHTRAEHCLHRHFGSSNRSEVSSWGGPRPLSSWLTAPFDIAR